MAYVPSARTITVDLGTLSGPVTARWYDPTNGTFTAIGDGPLANNGSVSLATPGANATARTTGCSCCELSNPSLGRGLVVGGSLDSTIAADHTARSAASHRSRPWQDPLRSRPPRCRASIDPGEWVEGAISRIRDQAYAGAGRPRKLGEARPAARRGRGEPARRCYQASRDRRGDVSPLAQSIRRMKADDVKRLKELEAENPKLKRMVADQALDTDQGSRDWAAGNF